MKRTCTAEQQEKAEARRKTFRELAGRIGAMTPEERGALAASLPAIATVEGRVLSPFNQCLIASQCPSATLVGGFRQWVKAGRCVSKGQHGLALWCPTGNRTDDNGVPDDGVHFIMGTVFDVSQTCELAAAHTDREAQTQHAIASEQAEATNRSVHAQVAELQKQTARTASTAQADYYSTEFTPTA